jgi:hypothetical protein
MIVALISIVCVFGIFTIYLCFPLVTDVVTRPSGSFGASSGALGLFRTVAFIIRQAIGLLTISMIFRVTPRIRLAARARQEYERFCRQNEEQKTPAA